MSATQDLLSEIQNLIDAIQNFETEVQVFCDLIPPVKNVEQFLASLPIVLLYLVTIPLRFFICLLASVFEVNPLCLIYNLFPFISLIEPLETSSSSTCPCCGCKQYDCINFSNPVLQAFSKCTPSVLNTVFCLIGGDILLVLEIFLQFFNPIIAKFVGKQICVNVNFGVCTGGSQ